MERDNRILIGSVIIIVLVSISFNFSFTGGVVKDVSGGKIKVSPEVINSGDVVYFDVFGGVKGINNKADFIYAIDDLRKSSKKDICGEGHKCTGDISFSYFIPPNWESGIYYVVFFDYASGEFIKKGFTVVN